MAKSALSMSHFSDPEGKYALDGWPLSVARNMAYVYQQQLRQARRLAGTPPAGSSDQGRLPEAALLLGRSSCLSRLAMSLMG